MKIEYEQVQWKSRRDVPHSERNAARRVERDSCSIRATGEELQSLLGGEPFQILSILVPTDFSPCASHALRRAVDLAQRHGAVITLLHVVDLNLHTPSVGPANCDKLRADLWKEGLAQLGRLAMDVARERVEARTLIREGLPAEKIAETARTHDLIVIGKHKTRPFWRWFSRRTVETLVVSAPCPVLVVREPQETVGIN